MCLSIVLNTESNDLRRLSGLSFSPLFMYERIGKSRLGFHYFLINSDELRGGKAELVIRGLNLIFQMWGRLNKISVCAANGL